MPRNIDNSIQQRLFENHRQVVFVEIDFASAPIRVHSGFGEYLFNGNTFYGVSAFGSITVRSEDIQINPARITLGLTGVDNRFIQEIETYTNYQNRDVYIWKCLVDDNYQLIGSTGQLWYRGTTGNAVITEEPNNTLGVTIDVNNFLSLWNRPSNIRLNAKTHATLYPGDTIFQYLVDAQGGKVWRGA